MLKPFILRESSDSAMMGDRILGLDVPRVLSMPYY